MQLLFFHSFRSMHKVNERELNMTRTQEMEHRHGMNVLCTVWVNLHIFARHVQRDLQKSEKLIPSLKTRFFLSRWSVAATQKGSKKLQGNPVKEVLEQRSSTGAFRHTFVIQLQRKHSCQLLQFLYSLALKLFRFK